MTQEEIDAIETAAIAFGSQSDLGGAVARLTAACREYLLQLLVQNPDAAKINLSQLQRSSPAAYERVLAVLPAEQRAEAVAFVAQFSGQPLPSAEIQPLSAGLKISPPARLTVAA